MHGPGGGWWGVHGPRGVVGGAWSRGVHETGGGVCAWSWRGAWCYRGRGVCLVLWGGASSQGGMCLVTGGCVPGPGEGLVSQHALRQPPLPGRDGYSCGRFASYWNAFLFDLLYKLLIGWQTFRHLCYGPIY